MAPREKTTVPAFEETFVTTTRVVRINVEALVAAARYALDDLDDLENDTTLYLDARDFVEEIA